MISETQCIEALTAAEQAASEADDTYLVPSRVRRALLLCQRYLAEKESVEPPLFPAENLPFSVSGRYLQLATAADKLALRVKRFQFMSEALQDLVSRQDGKIRADIQTMKRELSALAGSTGTR